MTLATLGEVKTHLGITGTDEDTRLTQFLDDADAIILEEIQRTIESATYTEYYEGTGRRELVLRNYPVTSVTSVHDNSGGYFGDSEDGFAAAHLLTAGTDYVLRRDNQSQSNSGILYRIKGVWPAASQSSPNRLTSVDAPALGNIKVVYVAGYATVPKDLRHACCNLVAVMRLTAELGTYVASQSMDYYSYSVMGQADLEKAIGSVNRILRRYKSWTI